MKTDMWPRMLKLLKFISNESDWHPYDVAMNGIRCADNTQKHSDSEEHQVNAKSNCDLLLCLFHKRFNTLLVMHGEIGIRRFNTCAANT